MKGRALTVLAILATVALAGCTDDGDATTDNDDEVFSSLQLQQVSDRGIIRGVIIDEAIRPVSDATIVLAGPEGEESTTSNQEGAFGFDGLAPGDHFLTVTKNGFTEVQHSTIVEAGVDPDTLKIMLTADPEALAFVEEIVERGYVECSTPNLAACYAVEILSPETLQEKSQFRYPVERTPDHLQTEMVWQNSQALNGDFSLLISYDGCGDFYCDNSNTGPSPLMTNVRGEEAVKEQTTVDGERQIYIRVFSGGLEESDPAGLGVRAGASFQQDFELITHSFYNFEPPEDWRFTTDQTTPEAPE